MNTLIPPQFAADMAAAARREVEAEREQRKTMVLFAIAAIAVFLLIYKVW